MQNGSLYVTTHSFLPLDTFSSKINNWGLAVMDKGLTVLQLYIRFLIVGKILSGDIMTI